MVEYQALYRIIGGSRRAENGETIEQIRIYCSKCQQRGDDPIIAVCDLPTEGVDILERWPVFIHIHDINEHPL